MRIGVPKETKTDERRISLTPDKVDLLVRRGHSVAVETNAGIGSGFPDENYQAVGADIVGGPPAVFEDTELVVKVKEVQPYEYELLNEDTVVFTYLHLAAEPDLARALVAAKTTSIAYETIQDADGSLPLLYPMSEIAGKLAALTAGTLVQSHWGGPGKLMSHVPGIEPCRVTIVGGGTVGLNAALVASAMGSEVTIADINLGRLRYIDALSDGRIKTAFSSPANLADILAASDVVIGAVLLPGASAPKVVEREMISNMADGAVVIDVAIDHGGSVEGIRPTSHSDPTYLEDGVVHYAVPNMPGIVPVTSSMSLSNATLPYVLVIADNGIEKLIQSRRDIAKGVNTIRGHVTYEAVAEGVDLPYTPLEEALTA